MAIVDELAVSDRSPSELSTQFDLPTNLLAHHLDVLDGVGLIERIVSTGDRRRRYVRLRREPLADLGITTIAIRAAAPNNTSPAVDTVLFVCTHNSARSQLAAAIWSARTGNHAESAGTHPADRVHPGAVAAARRGGLDLSDATPRLLDPAPHTDMIVTVCDRAHEELVAARDRWHWSIPDPIDAGTDAAFDAVVADLDSRISALT